MQFQFVGSEACKNLEHVAFLPKWRDSREVTGGACTEASWNRAARTMRQLMIPNIDMIMSLLLPYLSTKNMLTIDPMAFRPEVMRERARAVLFEAYPANCTIVGL